MPDASLEGSGELALNLYEYACGFSLIIYLYAGCERSPEDGEDTALCDSLQHRAFREHRLDLEARGYRAIGVSSQDARAQHRATLEHRLTHMLLSDPGLRLAQRLGLPTFTYDGVKRYCRLMLVVHDGRIVKVFFPVCSAARSAAQVIAWMTIQGIS
jgi:peroxiredoxin